MSILKIIGLLYFIKKVKVKGTCLNIIYQKE